MSLHSTEGLRKGASGESSFQALSSEPLTAGLQSPADSGNLTPQQRHENDASRNPREDRSGVSAAALLAVGLPTKRAEALRWVTAHPGCSARELERMSGLRKINARLSELEAQGVVEGSTFTTCSVTGHVATAWRPTGNAPRPLPRTVTARERVRQLEAEVERLQAELAEAKAARGQLDLPVWGHQ